jgi:ATP adenylyltransferase
MDRLYTPWRLDYVKSDKEAGGCIFCNAFQGDDGENYILHRSRHWYVILNRYPYNCGHVLLVTNRHLGALADCGDEEVADLAVLMQAAERALREVYRPHGINCGYNGGGAAGAGIPAHFHVHLLPRWHADTNFISVVGDTRVLPETLDDSYAGLGPALARALDGTGL